MDSHLEILYLPRAVRLILLGRQRQKYCKFKASLGKELARPYIKNKIQKNQKGLGYGSIGRALA
jgi:hypothetical protein